MQMLGESGPTNALPLWAYTELSTGAHQISNKALFLVVFLTCKQQNVLKSQFKKLKEKYPVVSFYK